MLLTNIRAHSSLSCMAAKWSAVLPCFPPWPTSIRSLKLHITWRTATRFSSTAKCKAACFLSFNALGSAPLYKRIHHNGSNKLNKSYTVSYNLLVCALDYDINNINKLINTRHWTIKNKILLYYFHRIYNFLLT